MKLTLSIEKTFQGAWRIHAMVDGYRVSRQYFGYTRKEAIERFRLDVGA